MSQQPVTPGHTARPDSIDNRLHHRYDNTIMRKTQVSFYLQTRAEHDHVINLIHYSYIYKQITIYNYKLQI